MEAHELSLDFDEFMQQVLNGFRQKVIKDLAEAIQLPCVKCGNTHYHGTGAVLPCRDEDNGDPADRSGDHTHEIVWLCCMQCGQVYDTFDMEVAPRIAAPDDSGRAVNAIAELALSGEITVTEGDAEFVARIHEAVGYSFPGVRH